MSVYSTVVKTYACFRVCLRVSAAIHLISRSFLFLRGHGCFHFQCRERWCQHLDPRIVKSRWTAAEDEILVSMQKRIGNKWAQIARVSEMSVAYYGTHKIRGKKVARNSTTAFFARRNFTWFELCLFSRCRYSAKTCIRGEYTVYGSTVWLRNRLDLADVPHIFPVALQPYFSTSLTKK